MGLFLGFLSCSIGLDFCFCASTTLSSWLWLCSIIWSQEGWFLQLHSSFSRPRLFGVFCVSIWIVKIFCSSSVKNAIGNLIGLALNLHIEFGSIVIFTILILPTQEHGISLYLFMSSLISFINVLQFSVTVLLSL